MQLILFLAGYKAAIVVWMVLVFAGVLGWVYWPRRRDVYDNAAFIPFRDDR